MFASKMPDLRAQPFVDIDLKVINDEDLHQKIRDLREIVPESSILYVYCVLMTFNGNVDSSASLLLGDPPSNFVNKVTKLKDLFPESEQHQAGDVLIADMGDLEAAKQRLRTELAKNHIKAEKSVPVKEENSINTPEASSSHQTLTSTTTTTSHIHGVVNSFRINTKTHATNPLKPKPAVKRVVVDLTKEVNNSIPADPDLKQCDSPHPSPIKNEDADPINSQVEVGSLEDKIQRLVEFLPNAARDDCRVALQKANRNEDVAYNLLEERISVSSPFGAKRRSESPIASAFKKTRLETIFDDGNEAGGDDEQGHEYENWDQTEEEDDDNYGEFEVTPARQWIEATYPVNDSSDVIVYVGSDPTPRSRIPRGILCDKFLVLKSQVDAAVKQGSGTSQVIIRLPRITPSAFDLAAEFVIRGNISLGNAPNKVKISSILSVIEAAYMLEVSPLTLNTLTNRMFAKLRCILLHEHTALSPSHIRKVYKMEQIGVYVEEIQHLFVSALVKRRMQNTTSGLPNIFQDEDEEGMSAAQMAAYSGANFDFDREMRDIPDFGHALIKAVFECLENREHRVIKRREIGVTKKIKVPVFKDPLTDADFEL